MRIEIRLSFPEDEDTPEHIDCAIGYVKKAVSEREKSFVEIYGTWGQVIGVAEIIRSEGGKP